MRRTQNQELSSDRVIFILMVGLYCTGRALAIRAKSESFRVSSFLSSGYEEAEALHSPAQAKPAAETGPLPVRGAVLAAWVQNVFRGE
jgi:hypothetical protein